MCGPGDLPPEEEEARKEEVKRQEARAKQPGQAKKPVTLSVESPSSGGCCSTVIDGVYEAPPFGNAYLCDIFRLIMLANCFVSFLLPVVLAICTPLSMITCAGGVPLYFEIVLYSYMGATFILEIVMLWTLFDHPEHHASRKRNITKGVIFQLFVGVVGRMGPFTTLGFVMQTYACKSDLFYVSVVFYCLFYASLLGYMFYGCKDWGFGWSSRSGSLIFTGMGCCETFTIKGNSASRWTIWLLFSVLCEICEFRAICGAIYEVLDDNAPASDCGAMSRGMQEMNNPKLATVEQKRLSYRDKLNLWQCFSIDISIAVTQFVFVLQQSGNIGYFAILTLTVSLVLAVRTFFKAISRCCSECYDSD